MVDGWIESKASLVIQNVILLFINAIGVWRWYPKARRKRKLAHFAHLVAKSVTAQERLVDRDGRLRAFRYRYRHKKDVARHVAGNIHARDTAFFRVGIDYDAPFCTCVCSRDVSDRSEA